MKESEKVVVCRESLFSCPMCGRRKRVLLFEITKQRKRILKKVFFERLSDKEFRQIEPELRFIWEMIK